MKSLNESKYGFWGVLARKAKSLVEDDNASQSFKNFGRKQPQMFDTKTGDESAEGSQKAEALPSQRSPDSLASSLNHIGGTIKNKFEEGLTIMENRTADIIQETRKLNIRRKGSGPGQNQATDTSAQHFTSIHADHETQLKASRDVANAMAAKAKVLLRELKTIKADLAFAKERCAQLEEENKMLRENHEKGAGPEDDDLIRLQLETLLAEKGRLAHENSVYARENRFLREIVEYHQLTMQDVVYVDEGIEEVTEVFSNSADQILSRSSSVSNSFKGIDEVTEVFSNNPNQIMSRTSSISNSFNGASASFEHSSPAVSVPSTSTPTKPSSIVVPEACPVVPMPPTPSPRVTTGGVSEEEDDGNRQYQQYV
ncbi:uncharacterized protein LOC109844056 isoform X2 [Asparagus officinalis]|uniref:uncharacterized protein LOC109844056 isoform X2 n=1 Tax=Asparagus officinalis TaxID=4686 RepID=UPI00098E080E|nr:uncharacterized protein LOC109844056 isoform X2 [Asparagus officinalis]